MSIPRLRSARSALPALSIPLLTALAIGCTPSTDAPAPLPVIEVPAIERPGGETPEWWYLSGAAKAAANGAMRGKAKNVILFLGDGMSLTTVAAARILAGQREGKPGEETLLSWEHFPHTALSRTYNTDAQTPDSAGTMTAIAAGVKTHSGAIGVSAGERFDCADSQGKELQSWLRLAGDAGMASGIISTARLTHATPGAMYAHAPDREWENDSKLPADAVAAGCRDIAQQLLDFEPGRAPSVVLGGGRREFLPTTVQDPESPDKTGRRQDGRDLTAEWLAAHPDGQVVWNTRQFRAAGSGPILGLFEHDHMQYDHDRDTSEDGEPELAELTRAAITRLSQHPDGFVLMVEGARIDHANHEGNAFRALDETIAMSRAVQVAAEMTSPEDTLIIVTADHSHTLNFVGYPVRGNPILDKVRGLPWTPSDERGQYARDAKGQPYTTLSYANGPGHVDPHTHQHTLNPDTHQHQHLPRGHRAEYARPDLTEVDTQHPDYLQEALIPMRSETHGGDDVGVWARGPGSDALRGSIEQHVIYHVLVQATPKLRQQLCTQGGCNADGVPVTLPVFTHPGLTIQN